MRAGLYFNWTALEKGVPWGPVGSRAWGQANNNLLPATASPCYSPPVILKMTAGRSPSLYSVWSREGRGQGVQGAGGQRLEQEAGGRGGEGQHIQGGLGRSVQQGGRGQQKNQGLGNEGNIHI